MYINIKIAELEKKIQEQNDKLDKLKKEINTIHSIINRLKEKGVGSNKLNTPEPTGLYVK